VFTIHNSIVGDPNQAYGTHAIRTVVCRFEINPDESQNPPIRLSQPGQ
jgi:hypothetical protein